jgi:hypothetical protein
MVKARSDYKSTIRKCRYDYDKEKTNKLLCNRHKNARLYWNMLKEAAGIKRSNISMSMFEKYFKAVNNPDDSYFSPDEDVIYFIERYEKDEFRIMFNELNTCISVTEITTAIKQLKNNRSGGPDCLINEFF